MISKQNSFAFEEGHPLPKPFNVEDNEGGGTLSIDNNLLFFTKCSKISGNYNNCDIYFSEKDDGIWGDIQSLNAKICPKYSWESKPLCPLMERHFSLQAIEMGYGGIDIYKITKIILESGVSL